MHGRVLGGFRRIGSGSGAGLKVWSVGALVPLRGLKLQQSGSRGLSCLAYPPSGAASSPSSSSSLRVGRVGMSSSSTSSKEEEKLKTKMEIAVDGNIDRFSLQAKEYAKFRPRYPPELFQVLLKYDGIENETKKVNKLALDVATGTGFMADLLSKHYERAIGIDRSKNLLEKAIQRENIRYELGSAYETQQPDRSVNVLTVAQAIHWFDLPKFFQEVRRVLVPGTGVFATLGYSVPTLASVDPSASSKELQEAFSEYYRTLATYWDCDRTILDNQLRDVEFPFDDVQRTVIPWSKEMSLPEFDGYLVSWSAWQTWLERHANEPGPTPKQLLLQRLSNALGGDLEGKRLRVTWPFFIICCRAPKA